MFLALFVSTGIMFSYVAALVVRQTINDNALAVVPLLGIVFPNLLLFRGYEEINYYEDIGELFIFMIYFSIEF